MINMHHKSIFLALDNFKYLMHKNVKLDQTIDGQKQFIMLAVHMYKFIHIKCLKRSTTTKNCIYRFLLSYNVQHFNGRIANVSKKTEHCIH